MKRYALLLVVAIIGSIAVASAQYLNTDGSNNMTGPLNVEIPASYASIELKSTIGSFIDFHSSVSSDFDGRLIWNQDGSNEFGLFGKVRFHNMVLTNDLIGVGLNTPKAGIHVTKTYAIGDGSKVAARFGDAHFHWTYFGDGHSGRIRGSGEGYLWIESNANGGGDKMLYLNASSPGHVNIAAGGGNVLIGKITQSNSTYKLDVAGSVRANEIVVNTTGADYVFEDNYELKSLDEVEDFIEQNGHLPGIPSAPEMQEEGMAVGELNTKLSEKVEELTLFIIKQNNRLKHQEQELTKLKRECLKSPN
ncbi:hypothetical protein FNH22_24045 [Fulvivirga sp. M361]|uniref:hypothetical protein n=1 Tax=Fulvivirga sp. M361 TaxID=2594266 RepID=UPI00117B8D0E|nr:hypothetical protein [Fulvivirga sp. M361]TRX51636.1 hypothetical protein FNH22_24045 [Fulvivirga sp. M361]